MPGQRWYPTKQQLKDPDAVEKAFRQVLTQLVTRAQDAGAVRSDIGPADVAMLFSGVAHATALVGDLQPVLRERYVRIILDGLRPADASPLPGRPLSFAELRRAKARNLKRRAE